MASPSEKLAASLEALHQAQEKSDSRVLRTKDISRTHRERLVHNGFLQEVIKGWYILSRPNEVQGDSTSWYTSYWDFCKTYLNERFGTDWVLSPEQSILIHTGNMTVPRQLLVRAAKGQNNILNIPHGTSIFDIRSPQINNSQIEEVNGVRVYTLAEALRVCPASFYVQNPVDARSALSMFSDASEILELLLDDGQSTVAGRIAGAFREIGRSRIADDIIKTMQAAGYEVRENNPFTDSLPPIVSTRDISPYVNRIRLLWQQMRDPVLQIFPKVPGIPKDFGSYLKQVEENYQTDAYHSLSIEGYQVTLELIQRVRSGLWNPDREASDSDHRSALAARGYWQAFMAVRQSVERILRGENAGKVANEDHGDWYREMFAPSVAAGILKARDLIGYRNHQVYIRRSMHVPLNRDAVRDAMPALFELLAEEKEAAVRVVLGHFIFVYIHPYMDGNGRLGRFLMNTMLASGGYPWTVVPLSERESYMQALEKASVDQDISAFAAFLAKLVTGSMTARVK